MTDEAIRFYAWIRSAFPRRELRITTRQDDIALVAHLVEPFRAVVTPLEPLWPPSYVVPQLVPEAPEWRDRLWPARQLHLQVTLDALYLHPPRDHVFEALAVAARSKWDRELDLLHPLQAAQQVP